MPIAVVVAVLMSRARRQGCLAQDTDNAEDEVEKLENAGKTEDASDARPDTDGDTADRGKSGEHRQDR